MAAHCAGDPTVVLSNTLVGFHWPFARSLSTRINCHRVDQTSGDRAGTLTAHSLTRRCRLYVTQVCFSVSQTLHFATPRSTAFKLPGPRPEGTFFKRRKSKDACTCVPCVIQGPNAAEFITGRLQTTNLRSQQVKTSVEESLGSPEGHLQ